MTSRQINIAKSILEALYVLDGGQAQSITIHADASLLFRQIIPLNEFEEVFAQLNSLGCFTGVATRFKGTLWSLSPKGEQMRQEMP
jgi:hypothetical protein